MKQKQATDLMKVGAGQTAFAKRFDLALTNVGALPSAFTMRFNSEQAAQMRKTQEQIADFMARYNAKQAAQMRETQEQIQRINENARKKLASAIAREVLRELSRKPSRDDDSVLRSSPRDEII